ncbi:hypothetical protein IW140_001087 [Coemansia sp. RSA 1813]|nr:hypothetical protein EV178_002314 [Coemansia sp. RSA 1646]KAJ1773119.1 hypothetical protein LPJ74_000858 [Coemansia sp. RSA 1843]KAJ2091996.1 hypothetical protein IW138_001362 [Coemansia sp. RSA 986]KAJ2216667.1 hypothetical protein EV179_001206 [Coemansia sp. RSA 487]KAJ2572047.1 hypothetical protein IW140_001087 [Coemansia sp. RSA 1813]
MLQCCKCHVGALLGVRGKLVSTAGLTRFYSVNKVSTPKEAATKEPAADESQHVVDPSPVYTASEAEATGSSEDAPKESTGSRTRFLGDQEPVVVHDMNQPIQSGKWYRIVPENFDFNQVGTSHIARVPTLAHGLERVLFNPGVHYLQDPNSGVYNFNPYIRNITQPEEFDYDKLTPYITSSKDERLMGYARGRERRFVGSTSSMTHVLSHLYFLISASKQPDISSMSMAFEAMPERFTRGMRYPASIALRYHDGVYGIDADKSFDVKDSILSVLGKSLEMVLTSTPKEFEKYKKENSWKVKGASEENYHYVEFDEFVLRSQLDCRDDRLPRKTFDLKTRGSLAVRMDIQNYEKTKGYQILSPKGLLQSFEREYFDMVRSAFLKYNFQVRIGNMDGIFVAYHNTARMFGFQYISRGEMDRVLYGNEPTGTKAFRSILVLLGKILRTITEKYSKKDLRITFDGRSMDRVEIWVEVIDDKGEEEFLRKYQEPGFLHNIKQMMKVSPPSKEASTDPLNTGDPFEPASQENDSKASDKPLTEDTVDDYLDPEKEIFVNTNEPILHYTLETFSTINGQDTDSPVTVKTKKDEWFINWRLTKSHKDQDGLAARYRSLRLRQATFFERNAPDTPDDELPTMLKILRRISQKNMWRNKQPHGRVVVNRTPLPKTSSPKTANRSAAASKRPTKHRSVASSTSKVITKKKAGTITAHKGRKGSSSKGSKETSNKGGEKNNSNDDKHSTTARSLEPASSK